MEVRWNVCNFVWSGWRLGCVQCCVAKCCRTSRLAKCMYELLQGVGVAGGGRGWHAQMLLSVTSQRSHVANAYQAWGCIQSVRLPCIAWLFITMLNSPCSPTTCCHGNIETARTLTRTHLHYHTLTLSDGNKYP